MEAYKNLVNRYKELSEQKESKIQRLAADADAKKILIQEKTSAYETAQEEDRAKIISSINLLKTEIQLLESQISEESQRDLKKDTELKELVRAVETEYYSELDNMRSDMAADVNELSKMISLINALYEKYHAYADKTSHLNQEIDYTGRYYMDEGDTLIKCSKNQFTHPNYMSPMGYVKYPEIGKPEGIYMFGENVVELLNHFGMEYITK